MMPERENANENDAASTSETASSSSTSTTSETMNLFGKYEVRKLLGYDTFAKVYHAWNVCTGQSVVIKAVSKRKVLKGGFMAHVKREISIMRRLHHPHIVKLFEVLATKTKIYFVMEFAKGRELFVKIVRGWFSEDLSRRYFQQLISAVGYYHSKGVFHRNLKPKNLLLDENWDLKVSDFGLSAVKDQIRPDGLLHTLCGMPAYVAPEILAKHATVFVLNSWVSWVNFCWVVVPIRVRVAVVGGSDLGLVRGLIRGLVLHLWFGL